MSSRQKGSPRRTIRADDSGQALVEFAISAVMMLTLLFGLIDFSRAIYFEELITNLTGEGSSMASRGTSLTDTATAVVAAASPLNLSTTGQVIVSSVFNNNNHIQLTGQVSQGAIGAHSRIGSVIGGAVTVPVAVVPQAGQTIYVTEVFYKYQAVTPIGNFLTAVLPSQLYDVAYY